MSKKHKKRQSNKFSLLLRLFVHLLLCLLYKQLVNSSTCSLVNLPCYFVFFTSNLLTRPLVHSSTYHVTLSSLQVTRLLVHLFTRQLTMLLCLLYKQLVNSSTCSLVHLPCKQLVNSSTCSLVNSSTTHFTSIFLPLRITTPLWLLLTVLPARS